MRDVAKTDNKPQRFFSERTFFIQKKNKMYISKTFYYLIKLYYFSQFLLMENTSVLARAAAVINVDIDDDIPIALPQIIIGALVVVVPVFCAL
jgi:hypothetical protein